MWRILSRRKRGRRRALRRRLTSGTSVEAKPSVISGGRIAFASLTQDLNIWSLPIAANSGQVSGGPQQVTGSAFDAHTSVSADGKKLVFISTRSGNPDVWMKDLESGKETALTATPANEGEAEITADGTRVCYVVIEGTQGLVYQIATTGGVPRKNLR